MSVTGINDQGLKGSKRTNRQKAEEERKKEEKRKEGIRTRQGFGELKTGRYWPSESIKSQSL